MKSWPGTKPFSGVRRSLRGAGSWPNLLDMTKILLKNVFKALKNVQTVLNKQL